MAAWVTSIEQTRTGRGVDPTPQTCPPEMDCLVYGALAYRQCDPVANALLGPPFAMSGGATRMVIGEHTLWTAPGVGHFVIRAPLGT